MDKIQLSFIGEFTFKDTEKNREYAKLFTDGQLKTFIETSLRKFIDENDGETFNVTAIDKLIIPVEVS